MKVLYVTTFNQRLYDLSGRALIKTFLEKTNNSDFLVCYEEMDFKSASKRIKVYDIKECEFFTKWISENLHNIPKFYGGLAEDNDKRFLLDKEKGKDWARFRASRYFRKVSALKIALDNYGKEYDIIFLVDADCIFKKGIDNIKIDELFREDISMFYFWGKYRRKINRGPESGFTGYMKKNMGFEFANKICSCFSSGDFIKYEYWDDGFVIGRLIEENKEEYNFKDLVGKSNIRTTRVMEISYNPLFNYIHHFKNRHKY